MTDSRAPWPGAIPALVQAAVFVYLLSLALPRGETAALSFLALAGFASQFDTARHAPGRDPESRGLLAALLAFVALSLCSVAVSIDSPHAVDVSLSLFPSALSVYLVGFHFDPRALHRLCLALALQAALVASLALWTALNSPDPDPTLLMSRLSLLFVRVPNDLLILAAAAPFTIALGLKAQGPALRLVALFSLVSGLLAIVIYRSNAAMLGLGAGAVVMGWPRFGRRVLFLVPGLVALFILVDALQGFALMDKFFHASVWGNRLPLWLTAWDMFRDAPWFGQGPGAFSLVFDANVRHPALPDWVTPDVRHAPWAHNLYLELLSERGLAGCVAFLLVAARLTGALRRIASRRDDNALLATAALASLVSLLVAGLVELSLLRHWVMIAFSLVCGTAVALIRQDPARRIE